MRSALLLLGLLLAGCALTSKASPLEIRYFTPDVAGSLPTLSAAALQESDRPALRLGRLTSSDFLRSEIVYRVSAHEVATYEALRWTEYPEEYVRRSLVRVLWDSGRFVLAPSGPSAELDVDLLGFEELRRDDARAGRVQLAYRLRRGAEVLASDVITVEREAAGGDPPEVVAAIGSALDEAIARLATALERALGARARTLSAAPPRTVLTFTSSLRPKVESSRP